MEEQLKNCLVKMSLQRERGTEFIYNKTLSKVVIVGALLNIMRPYMRDLQPTSDSMGKN